MKKLLIGCVALSATMGVAWAADLPAAAPAPAYKAPIAVPSTYSWTGFYVGANAGWAWNRSTDNITATNAAGLSFTIPGDIATSLPLNSSGFIGGGQVGYNWQMNPMWVVGLESDIQGANLKNTLSLPGPNDVTRIMTASEKLDLFGTVRGRVGITPSDHMLLYATGGLAYGNASLSTALTRPGFTGPPAPANGCGGFNNCQAGSATETRIGWTVGAGLEWAFVNNWSLKAEYLYYDLGSISHSMTDPFFPAAYNASANLKGSIARIGVNYRFGGPVVAKY